MSRELIEVNHNPPRDWNEMKDLIREYNILRDYLTAIQHEIDSNQAYFAEFHDSVEHLDHDPAEVNRESLDLRIKGGALSTGRFNGIRAIDDIIRQIRDISGSIFRIHRSNTRLNRRRNRLVKAALQYLFTMGRRKWNLQNGIRYGLMPKPIWNPHERNYEWGF